VAREVGIVITAKDAAGAVLKGVVEGLKGTGEAAAKVGEIGKGSFEGFERAITATHHSIRLARELYEMTLATFVESIQKAYEFRDAHDGARAKIKELGEAIDVTRARLGDAFIPILKGAAEAFVPLLKGAQEWLAVNQKLIASSMLEWVLKIGHGLVDGIATGVSLVSKAWLGWQMVVEATKVAINSYYAEVGKSIAYILSQLALLANAAGLKGMTAQLASAAIAVDGLGKEFESSADKASAALQGNVNALDAVDKTIEKVRASFQSGLARAGVQAQQAIQAATVGTGHSLEDQQKIAERIAQRNQVVAALEKKISDDVARHEDENARRRLEVEQKFEEQAKQTQQLQLTIASAVTSAWSSAFASIISGSEDAGVAIADASIKSAETAVNAAAASAAAQAAFSQAGIPILGPALAIAASGLIFGVVHALLGKIRGHEHGGLVTGGVWGRDSVPAMLAPGERVLTTQENKRYEQGGGGKSGDVHVHLAPHFVGLPSNEAEAEKILRTHFVRPLQKLMNNGMMRVPATAVK
jgi:hypothetical protein